ncbi:LysR substrate-binding domain-containing protein [Xanthobacteraceae bacterium Astr-EGSB]|uniref:LysR substrate-binding domain-containing protein n=1 Tax=Astrobacterium formosum TaxID=3069710 RepID=UPI0027B221C9|nr:LysR substrate-binding domain-containing protein [Xanthobacteraceae bacterium Astr-EGSB]
MFEFRELKYFLTVVQEMHFTRAAEMLHMTQPALSRAIQHMEERLGEPLFCRHQNKEISLTPLGEILYNEAKLTIMQVARSDQILRRAVARKGDIIEIGFTMTSILGHLPARLQVFHARHPGIEIHTCVLPIESLLAKLQERALDIICVDSSVIGSGLDSSPLPALPMAVALHHTHRLACGEAPVALADLKDDVFILPTPHKIYELYNLFRSVCREAGFEPNCQYFADSAVEGIGLVAANLAVDLMHELPLIRPASNVVLKRISPEIPLEMQLVWRRGDVSEQTVKFLEAHRSFAAQTRSR